MKIDLPNMDFDIPSIPDPHFEPKINYKALCINDGDFCVFRANPAGSRQGKIVLVQHTNYYDADYSGAYSIKEYSSAKSYDEFGNWQHEKIELKPYNHDYNPITINEEDAEDFRVIGEFVDTLDV